MHAFNQAASKGHMDVVKLLARYEWVGMREVVIVSVAAVRRALTSTTGRSRETREREKSRRLALIKNGQSGNAFNF